MYLVHVLRDLLIILGFHCCMLRLFIKICFLFLHSCMILVIRVVKYNLSGMSRSVLKFCCVFIIPVTSQCASVQLSAISQNQVLQFMALQLCSVFVFCTAISAGNVRPIIGSIMIYHRLHRWLANCFCVVAAGSYFSCGFFCI